MTHAPDNKNCPNCPYYCEEDYGEHGLAKFYSMYSNLVYSITDCAITARKGD